MPVEIITDELELKHAGFHWRAHSDVRALCCAPLEADGFTNAFSTRLGGVSPMPQEALNLAGFTDDAPEYTKPPPCPRALETSGGSTAASAWLRGANRARRGGRARQKRRSARGCPRRPCFANPARRQNRRLCARPAGRSAHGRERGGPCRLARRGLLDRAAHARTDARGIRHAERRCLRRHRAGGRRMLHTKSARSHQDFLSVSPTLTISLRRRAMGTRALIFKCKPAAIDRAGVAAEPSTSHRLLRCAAPISSSPIDAKRRFTAGQVACCPSSAARRLRASGRAAAFILSFGVPDAGCSPHRRRYQH